MRMLELNESALAMTKINLCSVHPGYHVSLFAAMIAAIGT